MYFLLRQMANRLKVLTIHDLSEPDARDAILRVRASTGAEVDERAVTAALQRTGGRLSLLNLVAHEADMEHAAKMFLKREKAFLLAKAGLIPDCDDDVRAEVRRSMRR